MYKILEYDNYLLPYEKDIELRMDRLFALEKRLFGESAKDGKDISALLLNFASAHEYFGFHREGNGYIYREYAPNAKQLFLCGDFNGWSRTSHELTPIGDGVFEINISQNIVGSRVKVRVVADSFDELKIPMFADYVTRDDHYDMAAQIFDSKYKFSQKPFTPSKDLVIYEAHIGMATETDGIGTYEEFRKNVLPKIKADGYTAIQLMGIMEHPYYASFGYQVSNFFAPSSLYGTPDELRKLIDSAHKAGIAVLLDIVHSHASGNTNEGLSMFDGTDDMFFMGDHPAWGTKVFDYSKNFTLKFLLSNVKYYLDKFHFDGFRFDGVTSMLYTHYGLGVAFDNYSKYFSPSTNLDAINYLQLATSVTKATNDNAILIAEDMSAMPGMCIPVNEGGIGFDYRLALGEPDLWIKLIKECRDEDWNMNHIYWELSTRRPHEKNVGYAECHDQALVGDKTIIFRLCDKEMYWHMQKEDNDLTVERGVALYKNIYGITMALGGEGYLNFMGNEFGHPEWIDFPREGNGWSYKYAKRQWHLCKDENLKFSCLNEFNKDLIKILKKHDIFGAHDRQVYVSDEKKIIAFVKNDLLFVVSFNPTESFTDLAIENVGKNARLIFTSDDEKYCGHGRLTPNERHVKIRKERNCLKFYVPNRTFNVFKLY